MLRRSTGCLKSAKLKGLPFVWQWFSYVEYSEFYKGTFCYYVNYSDGCETRQCVKKIQPYVKFIDSLCDKDLEVSNLLKKLPGNIHGTYSSLTQCCCGHEF